jgi:hypothetical protein
MLFSGAHTFAPTPCGDDRKYCPLGSPAPFNASVGFYTGGAVGQRVEQVPCPLGQYCNGSGVAVDCPLGTFGDVEGLTNASCAGRCVDGALCLPRSTAPQGVPCPQGFVCLQGVASPCPVGTYNPTTGAASASIACIPCPAGTYNSGNGSTSVAACVSCPRFEDSAPGASVCWPGLRGALSPYHPTACVLVRTLPCTRLCTSACHCITTSLQAWWPPTRSP